jgi:autotransporter-associated beta strand protein
MKPKSSLRRFLFLAGSSLLAVSSASAQYYWDGDDVTAGFGTASGTWADPTAGTLTSGWSTSNAGTATVDGISVSTLTTDAINFGLGATGLGAGTINVSGTVNSGNITFASGSGATVLSGGTINLAAATSITVNNTQDTIDSILSGAGTSLTKLGTGRLTLGGSNSYTGTTAVSAGTLRLTNTGAVASSSVMSLATGTTLELRKDDTGGTFTNTRLNPVGTVTINADRISSGSGQTLTLGGTIVYAGGFTSTINFTGANSYDVGVNAMYFNAGTSNQSFTLNPTTANAKIGVIRVNTNNTNPDGWGAGTANNVNFFLGGGAGTNNTIASITEISGAGQQFIITKNTAATWTLGNVNVRNGNGHTVSAGILNLDGTFEWTSTGFDRRITVNGTGQLNYNNAGALKTLNGRLQMTAGSMDNTSGAAITTSTHNPGLELAGNWTFIGSNGADSDLNFGTGIVRITGTAGTNRTINVQNANTKLTLGGVISSFTLWNNNNALPNVPAANGLIKAGNGTLELRGINTYTGATAVNAGTLEIASTGRINTSSGVTINGGTLRYNSSTDLSPTVTFTSGTIAGTNWNGSLSGQTIGTGQTISPGNSPGTATTGSQTWASGGSYLWEVNNATGTAGADPGWDLETGTGTLDISATNVSPFNILVTSLTLANAGGLATNFNDATSYNWLFADFASITGFAANAFYISTSDFDNTFTGTFGVSLGGVGAVPGDNSQIYLTYTAIPEPSAALLGGLGMLLLLRRRRA